MLAVSSEGKSFPNLSFEERKALRILKSGRSFVIKQAIRVLLWSYEIR